MPGTSGPSHQWPERETTQYQVAIPTEDWDDWKDTVPRTVPLYERLHDLLVMDTAAATDGWDEETEQMVRMLSNRMRHRARRALTALENDNADRASEELETIVELAMQIEG